MSDPPLTLVFAGDLVLDEPDAGYWLGGIGAALRGGDLAIGHLEVPHTEACEEVAGDVPSPGAAPENLAALAAVGFGAVSLAGNHMADCGAVGIRDTIVGLDALGIVHAGAGPDLAAARSPAVLAVNGRRVALLSYNCVGPEFGWATEESAGVAYLQLVADDGQPITPRSTIAAISPAALEMLDEDIASARSQADVVIVAMHKGRVHTPAILEGYERPLAQAAIDRGADVVIGHHAHIMRGIEFHRGKPIFHGLGNGCVVTRALSPAQDHPARKDWAERRKALFGFEPDPEYTLAPFHPEAKHAMLGKVEFGPGGAVTASIIPIWVEPPGRPVLAVGERRDDVFGYFEHITRAAALPPVRIDSATGEVARAE